MDLGGGAQSKRSADFWNRFALRSTRMLDALGRRGRYRGREGTSRHAGSSGTKRERVQDWLISCGEQGQKSGDSSTLQRLRGHALSEEPGTIVFCSDAASGHEGWEHVWLSEQKRWVRMRNDCWQAQLASHAALRWEISGDSGN